MTSRAARSFSHGVKMSSRDPEFSARRPFISDAAACFGRAVLGKVLGTQDTAIDIARCPRDDFAVPSTAVGRLLVTARLLTRFQVTSRGLRVPGSHKAEAAPSVTLPQVPPAGASDRMRIGILLPVFALIVGPSVFELARIGTWMLLAVSIAVVGMPLACLRGIIPGDGRGHKGD